MDESFIPGSGDGADQALSEATETLQRTSSLLERINAQREREAMSAEEEAVAAGNLGTDVEMNNNGLQVPSYSPIPNNDATSGGVADGGVSLNPFGSGSLASGFSRFSAMSMSLPQVGYSGLEQDQSSESLLSEQVGSLSREYSMTAYFKMLVIDVYSLFKSMPVPVQICTVVFLLWMLWKLL